MHPRSRVLFTVGVRWDSSVALRGPENTHTHTNEPGLFMLSLNGGFNKMTD